MFHYIVMIETFTLNFLTLVFTADTMCKAPASRDYYRIRGFGGENSLGFNIAPVLPSGLSVQHAIVFFFFLACGLIRG